ncbi:hypothetical protein [Vibrio sp. SCSIO 43169]|uniref:hypothetical protein n=1 Tax=Vibrio sp. SCSIO 43169 TaxID=2822801 RepID=UPI002044A8C8|nr:hypothetical protein [Vibrio sp. SCSIO 43169]MCM5511632.1 hypothetical protein [Vibrio sp. SCSIO 43169]
MSIGKPFHRNVRAMVNGPNSGYSSWAYIVDKDYSHNPTHYIRAFMMLQDDLQQVFEFVEPSDTNLNTHSFRIHELLMRTCIEIEANFRAILKENIYTPLDKKGKPRKEEYWNIVDFKKVDKTHRLSSYKVQYPVWDGTHFMFEPFKDWMSDNSLSWYKAYNASKHDRHDNFRQASFKNLLNAFAALQILITAQFNTESFSATRSFDVTTDSYHTLSSGIGDYLLIDFPSDWPEEQKYSFDWSSLKLETVRFQKFDYNTV